MQASSLRHDDQSVAKPDRHGFKVGPGPEIERGGIGEIEGECAVNLPVMAVTDECGIEVGNLNAGALSQRDAIRVRGDGGLGMVTDNAGVVFGGAEEFVAAKVHRRTTRGLPRVEVAP
jgi:hypothetical protein